MKTQNNRGKAYLKWRMETLRKTFDSLLTGIRKKKKDLKLMEFQK